jgi:hypothetical protein
MKRIAVFVLGLSVAVLPSFSDENNPEIAKSLEEINKKLDAISLKPGPGIEFGISLNLLEPMYMFETRKLNDYMAGLGSFAPMSPYFIPMLNGVDLGYSFTSPWLGPFSLQSRIRLWSQTSQGFLYHSQNPLYPDSLVDANGDGLVDYTSTITYVMGETDFAVSCDLEIVKDVFSIRPGVSIGLGKDTLNLSEWGAPSGLAFNSNPTWEKTFFSVGGSLAIDLYGVEIGGGIDYHVDLTGWQAKSGVLPGTAPAVDFNSMNATVWVNPMGLIGNLLTKKQ